MSMVIIPQPHYDNLWREKKIEVGGGGGGCIGVPPPPPPPLAQRLFSALAQHLRAGTAVARHFALPKQTPWRRP